jgi:peroxiredoxin
MLLVDLQDAEADARALMTSGGFNLPLMSDQQGTVAGRYGVSGIPAAVIVDKNGKIASTLVGGTTAAELEAAVAGLR